MNKKECKLEAIKRFVISQSEEYFNSVVGGETKALVIGHVWKSVGFDLEVLKELLVHEYIVTHSNTEKERDAYKLALDAMIEIFKACGDKVPDEE